jgi:hypothetical protein
MSASTNTLPNPIPQEKCAHAFKHVLKNVFSSGEHGKLWDAFKYYWMDDKTKFCIYTLISLSQADIEELVVLEAKGKTSPSPVPTNRVSIYSKHGIETFSSRTNRTMT